MKSNFSFRNVFQNGVNSLSKMVIKNPVFCVKKLKISCSLNHTSFFPNFTDIWNKHFLRNVWRDFRLSTSALATVPWKSFNGIFSAKIDFPIGHFILPLLMLTLKVESLSIHYLVSIWTTNWWNLNKIVWSEPYKILCFLTKKWLTIFDKVLTPFWKTFLWLKQLLDALKYWFKDYHLSHLSVFQNYDSRTRVTRLKVAPNMADSISLNENTYRSLNSVLLNN